MINLTGKVAIVTGSSRGIGRGSAIELARAGASVTVNYRTHPDEAVETAAAIRELGREALVVPADVADRAQVDAVVAQTCERFGRLDILVANAYSSVRKSFLELTLEDVERTWAVTLWGVFHSCQAAARVMVEQGEGGKLVIISSVHAFMPFGMALPYNTAKAGLNNMGYTIANELAPHRINVNVIEPGWIDTPGERQFKTDEELRAAGAQLPWGRMGTIQDIGQAVAFLCSPAADYITGACLRVDGGFWFPGNA
jgi:glucose 1-dehydrogenase